MQLERLDLAGVRHVRAAAQVQEIALLVERDALSRPAFTRSSMISSLKRCLLLVQAALGLLGRAPRSRRNGSFCSTIFCISFSTLGRSSVLMPPGSSTS